MRKLVYFFIFMFSFGAHAQMDSIAVNVYIEGTVPHPYDSTILIPMVKLDLTVDDFDFFGELFVEVADAATLQPLFRIKYKANQIVQEGLLRDGMIKIDLFPMLQDRPLVVYSRITDYLGVVKTVITRNVN